MDKYLHIHILDVLSQNNGIGRMVDIKPAFDNQLDTNEKRKYFKAQMDYLASQNLVQTNGKFEFLNWELLSGLYPIDNKKIEAMLIGNWQAYLADKLSLLGNREPIIIADVKPAQNTLAYPGTQVEAPVPAVPEKNTIMASARRDDKAADDHMPFTAKTHKPANNEPQLPPAVTADDSFLKEEDFLPYKVRNRQPRPEPRKNAEAAPPKPQPLNEDGEPVFTSPFTALRRKYVPPSTEEPGPIAHVPTPVATTQPDALPEEPVQPKAETDDDGSEHSGKATIYYTPPAPQPEPEPAPVPKPAFVPFRAAIQNHDQPAQPVANSDDVINPDAAPTEHLQQPAEALNETPTRTVEMPQPQQNTEPQKPHRIIGKVKRPEPEPEDIAFITARTASIKPAPITPPPVTQPAQPPAPAPQRVVNLSAAANTAPLPRPQHPVRQPAPMPAPPKPAAPVARAPIVAPGHSSIHFDTENNPFNSLGTITLSDKENKAKGTNWPVIIKWAIIALIVLVVIILFALYKKRYS